MEKNATAKGIIFLIVLGIIIVGGFILMQRSIKPEKKEEPKTEEKTFKDIRIDKEKDYIYFEDTDRIVDELDIEYKDVVINFDESTGVSEKLNKETAKFKAELEYDDELEESSYDKLTYAKYKVYEVYNYDKYISLVVKYYEFDRKNQVSYLDSLAYVFDKETGNLYTDEELLQEFEIEEDEMYKQIKDYVKGENLVKEGEELDAAGTLEYIEDPALYVDKIGRLSVSVLVKSSLKDYNEIIILD